MSIAFHYVKKDLQGKVAPAGVRTERENRRAEQDAWLDRMNRIYLPQANIGFTFASAPDIDSNGVRGPDVDVSPGSPEGNAIIQSRRGVDQNARFRVFFVGQIGSATRDGAVTLNRDDSLCQDSLDEKVLTTDPLKVGQVLAHEAGHCFNEPDVKDSPDLLMNEEARNGERIPMAVAQRMNDFLK